MLNEAAFPVLDPETLPAQTATTYPEEFRSVVDGREVRGLGDALGLRNFGVNLITLRPGAASAQRHWQPGSSPAHVPPAFSHTSWKPVEQEALPPMSRSRLGVVQAAVATKRAPASAKAIRAFDRSMVQSGVQ